MIGLALAGALLAAACAAPPTKGPGTAAADPVVVPSPPGDDDRENAEGVASGSGEPVPGETGARRVATEPTATDDGERSGLATPPADPVRRELIVLDPGTSQGRPEPGELARRTAAGTRGSPSRGTAPRITNENLGDYARGGQVTIAGTAATPAAPPGQETEEATEEAGEAAVAAGGDDEAFWRQSARAIREEWRRTHDEIAALETEAADLRWRFYAEDDPWLRDGQIKPEWDRVLDRLSEARRDLSEYPRRLDELIERGRHAGALPGWLREGIEVEPIDEAVGSTPNDPAEPVEPSVVDEGSGRDPGGGGR